MRRGLGRIAVLFVAAVAGLGLPVTATAAPASGVVPPGFTPSSTSWTSARNGWVLGFSSCVQGECAQLAHTFDGGRSWLASPTPPVQLTPEHDQVRVRFANELDGLITNGHQLWATHSGGLRWQLGALPEAQIGAIASNDRFQYAILTEATGTRLYSAPLRGNRWTRVPGIELPEAGGGDVVARGSSAFVALTSIFRSAGYWSTVDGQRWRPGPTPCTAEAQPRLGLAPDRTLFALCSSDPGRGFMAKELKRAEPDGTFSLVSTAPPAGITTGFGVVSPSTTAIAAVGAGAAFIHRGGTTWATPFVGDEVPLFDLAFTDASHGTFVSGGPGWGSAAVFRTTDGATSWTALTFH